MSANRPIPEAERDAIISRLLARHLETDRDTLVRERVDELTKRQTSKNRIEAHGLVAVGESGAGKSHTFDRIFRSHPAFPGYGEPGCPLVTIIVPAPCTMMQLGRVGCARVGYPIKGEKKLHRVWEIFREHLELAGVKYIHFDEIQNIMETANEKEAKAIRNILKGFLNDPDNRISLILTGLPKVRDFLQLDRQETRRCRFVEFETLEKDDAPAIHDAADDYATDAGLEIEPHEDAALGLRLLHAACYQLGLSFEMTIEAIEIALKKGVTKLTRFHYADMYASRTGNAAPANPFLADNYLDIDCSKVLLKDAIPETPPESKPAAPSKPTQARQTPQRNGRGW
jgi:hypothetical protein